MRRASGIVLIIGFAVLWIGALASPSGIYQETVVDGRLEIIENNQGQWFNSKIFDGSAVLTFTIGFVLLTFHLRGSTGQLTSILGMIALVIVAVTGLPYVYLLATDPAAIWQSTWTAWPGWLLSVLAISLSSGIILYGISFLQWNSKGKLGYLVTVYGALSLAAIVTMFGCPLILCSPFLVAAPLSFVILILGVALVRHR